MLCSWLCSRRASWVPTGSGALQGQQCSQAAVFRLVLPPELVLPLHSCADSCTQTPHYRLPGVCFLNERINVMNFVLAQKVKTPIPATSRNSHSNSVHNSPGTLFLSHSSNIACFQVTLFKTTLLEQYPSLLSSSGFLLFRLLAALGRDVFYQKAQKVLHIFHCAFFFFFFSGLPSSESRSSWWSGSYCLAVISPCIYAHMWYFFFPILCVIVLLSC